MIPFSSSVSEAGPSSFITPPSPDKMTFQKHPLLIPAKKRMPPTYADDSLSSSFSRSLILKDEERFSSSTTAKPRRSSNSPIGTIICNERTYSPATMEDEEKEDDQDADSVEASLRFPTFARRPLMFEGGSEKRKHSPVRSPMTLVQLSYNSSQSTSQDSEMIAKDAESTDLSTNEEELDEEEVLFSLDDEVQTNSLSGQGYDQEAKYDLHDGEEAIEVAVEDEEPSSLPLSLAYSTSSHSIRRQSNHSSAADLDMIWDEEDEGLTSALDSLTTLDDLEGNVQSNTSKLSSQNNQSCSNNASPRKGHAIAIVGGFDREASSIGQEDGQKSRSTDTSFLRRPPARMPLFQRSSSATRSPNGEQNSNSVRRLSFARRQGEYGASPQHVSSPSGSFHSSRRNVHVGNSPSKVVPTQREGVNRTEPQSKTASQPNLTAVGSQSSSSTSTDVTKVSNVHGRRVTLPLSAPISPLQTHVKMMTSSSNSSLAAMSVQENARGEQAKHQAHMQTLHGRKRGVTDPAGYDFTAVSETD
ncbi:uncharacterized protein FA14DRAFT_180234 [Meira miltonrushii]|uniref:Uncharacterized protein n=1 Tax=Meira miltonrushii TaxID=1280837 RepID=A0A316VDN2_9BASI|nr:uncharacterized protein FA14DRAFT_180234 [Meira miltonrushii]PWN33595.1 hypothetical protein FA14DRAFT_180234 [Meira miltonrushii]